MVHLITGYYGYEHIKSADSGSFNAAFFGDGQFVMEIGNQFSASIKDNNTVRLLDGDGLMFGRHFRVEPNTYEDVTIATGTAGKNRKDLICVTYQKNENDGTEATRLEVIKGTEFIGTAGTPAYTTGNILEGAIFNQMPLYEVNIEGVVLKSIKPLFTTIPTYKALAEKYEEQYKTDCEVQTNKFKAECDAMLEEVRAAFVGWEKAFNGVKRKLLSVIGTLKDLYTRFEDSEKNDNCRVSAVSSGEYVAMYCNNGANAFNVRLYYDKSAANCYEIATFKGWFFNRASLYTGTAAAKKTLKKLNIDGVYYNDFSVLESVGFAFENMILQYTVTATGATCYVTMHLNCNGIKIIETTSDGAVLPLIRTFVTSRSDNDCIKPIYQHNNVLMLFDIGNSTKPAIERIEDYGNTVIKTIDFVGVI